MAEVDESAISIELPEKQDSLFHKRSTKTAVFALTLAVLAIAGAFYLPKNAPPEAARLLPESDGIIYVDVSPMRIATRFNARPIKHDPDYQHFIDATGIQIESDLAEAAFALHQMSNPMGPNGPVAFSSIFVGKFDRQRLSSYLEGVSQSKENYAGHEVFSIGVEGRTDRVAILDAKTVAVSNTPTAEQIHSILDRHRSAFLPFSGNSLLARHYREVPLFSLAWGIGKLAAGLGDDLKIFGFRIPLSVNATFIASLRWAGALNLKVEEIAPNGAAAAISADSLEALLNIFKTAEDALPDSMTSPDTKALVSSIVIEHHNDRAVVTATVPPGLLQKLTAAPTAVSAAP